MSRYKAASLHLCISLLIAAIVGGLLFFLWFPQPYTAAAGADKLILLLIGVDVCIGPLLTLIVFNRAKPKRELRRDLTIIGLVQAIALIYGLSVVVQARPVFVVAAVDRYMLISADQLDDADLAKGDRPAFRKRSWTGPLLVGAKPPTGSNLPQTMLEMTARGKDVDQLPEYYVPYADVADALMERTRPLSELQPSNSSMREKLAEVLADAKRDGRTIRYLPVQRMNHNYTAIIDLASKRPFKVLDLDPWQAAAPAPATSTAKPTEP